MIYENNHAMIEGHTNIAFRDDIACRFPIVWLDVERIGGVYDLASFRSERLQ